MCVVPLSTERARELIAEFGGWFGPPLLCRVAPADIRQPSDVIDGAVRLASGPIDLVKVPHIVFPVAYRSGLYSKDGKLLPRLLVLFGHPDRAWAIIPEHWRDSAAALESFLRVRRETALEVWSVGLREKSRTKCRQIKGRKDHTHAEKIRSLRRLVEGQADGEPCTFADIAEILGVKL